MCKYTNKKNKEAPLRWAHRRRYPKNLSRVKKIIDSKACLLSLTKLKDRINPVMICQNKIIPKKEPKFQK
jgi:hypothetical protein